MGMLVAALSLIGTIGGGGYWLANNVPSTDDMKLAESKIEAQDAKTNYLYDIQMTRQIKEIDKLESKPNKTREEVEQLRYMREQLNEQRKMRSVK